MAKHHPFSTQKWVTCEVDWLLEKDSSSMNRPQLPSRLLRRIPAPTPSRWVPTPGSSPRTRRGNPDRSPCRPWESEGRLPEETRFGWEDFLVLFVFILGGGSWGLFFSNGYGSKRKHPGTTPIGFLGYLFLTHSQMKKWLTPEQTGISPTIWSLCESSKCITVTSFDPLPENAHT